MRLSLTLFRLATHSSACFLNAMRAYIAAGAVSGALCILLLLSAGMYQPEPDTPDAAIGVPPYPSRSPSLRDPAPRKQPNIILDLPRKSTQAVQDHVRTEPVLANSQLIRDKCGPWVQQYKTFHKQALQTLLKNPKDTSVKVMVYYCGREADCGGLGDSMSGIVGVFLYALLNNMLFFLKWDDLTVALQPNLVEWMLTDAVNASLYHNNLRVIRYHRSVHDVFI